MHGRYDSSSGSSGQQQRDWQQLKAAAHPQPKPPLEPVQLPPSRYGLQAGPRDYTLSYHMIAVALSCTHSLIHCQRIDNPAAAAAACPWAGS